MRALAVFLIAACGGDPSPPPPAAAFRPPVAVAAAVVDATAPLPGLVTPVQLFAHPEWIGKSLHVDLYEAILDEEHSSLASRDDYDVEIEDVGARRLSLVPAGDGKPLRELVAKHVPLRVYGEIRETARGLRIVASTAKPLAWPKPEKLANAEELVRDRARWAGRYVEVEDDYLVGFEASLLGNGHSVWLGYHAGVKVHCEPPRPEPMVIGGPKTYRVRVVGFAFTKGHYGHMSMRPAQIVATEVTYLDPARGCR